MKRGDISNRTYPSIAIHYSLIFDNSSKLPSILKKALKKVSVKQTGKTLLLNLSRKTDYNLYVLFNDIRDFNECKSLFEEVCSNDFVLIEKPSIISYKLLLGEYSYYVDDDIYRRNVIASKNAISLETFLKIAYH